VIAVLALAFVLAGPAVAAQVPADDVLLEVDADTDSPYVQARLRYRVRVLARVPLRGATLTEPTAEGARLRRLGKEHRFEVERGGLDYRVIERLYAVMAERTGRVTIHGPTLSGAVPQRALASTPGSDLLTEQLIERRVLVSRTAPPLTLDVRAPPPGAESPWLPAESVSIIEHWQPTSTELQVGEPIVRRLVIEAVGVGSASMQLPRQPAVEGLRSYPEPVRSRVQQRGDDLVLTTALTQTLVPTVPGILRVPALRLPWWSLGADAPREALAPARDFVVGHAGGSLPGAAEEASPWQQEFLARAWADPWGAVAILTVLFGAMLLLGLRGRQRRSTRAGAPAGPPVPAAEFRRRFRLACEREDAPTALAALSDWAATRLSHRGAIGQVAGALRERGASAEALASLRQLECCVYGANAAQWRGHEALDTIAPLLEPEPKAASAAPSMLPPLFPATSTRPADRT
jgi:hypothetical protein